jgi:hypothetical protein
MSQPPESAAQPLKPAPQPVAQQVHKSKAGL